MKTENMTRKEARCVDAMEREPSERGHSPMVFAPGLPNLCKRLSVTLRVTLKHTRELPG